MRKILLTFLGFAALAAATPVSVSFLNAGTAFMLDADSRALVGPYTLNIGGQKIPAMCVDDFYESAGTWSANVTSVTSNNLANSYLGNHNYTLNGIQVSSASIYLDEAYLYSQITKPGADRVDLQDAAWTLMDYVTSQTPHSIGDVAVNKILANLAANVNSFNASEYEIVTPIGNGAHVQQEFIVAMPEPASYGLSGGALLLLGMTRIWSKRSKRANA
ncbi:MAG TPA: hypothetical protein VH351_06250 [Bryobacteraceae bacterium]|jgi:hypothetical protein|nr:hypothetical protein [Bryobacteraceae bacterium]